MAFTPADAEDELKVMDEVPIATRLRSHSKIGDANTSQTQSTRDKPSEGSKDPHAKIKHSISKKTSVHNASSPLRIGQPSTTGPTKSSDSTSKKSAHTTSSRTGQPLTVDCNKKNNESKSKRVHLSSACTTNQVHLSSACTTNQPSNDQSAQNSKDSTPKRSGLLISSSSRKRQPSKEHQVTEKKIKDLTPEKSETRSKHLTNPHNKSKDSQPKRESSLYSDKQETKQSKISESKPSPSDVRQKKDKSIPSEKLATKSEFRSPMHYIRWEGFGKPRTQPTGWNCDLCEKDLANSPIVEEFEHSLPPEVELEDIDYSDGEFNDFLLPEVIVLPCNHVFHSMCLQIAASKEQITDLYCPMCSSWS